MKSLTPRTPGPPPSPGPGPAVQPRPHYPARAPPPGPGPGRAAPPAALISLASVSARALGLAPLIVTRPMQALRDAAGRGAGVLLVERYAGKALAVADRACILQRGRVVWSASAVEARKNLRRIEQAYLGQDETNAKA